MVLGSLIEKGLGAARAPTRTKCVDILLEFVAIDVAEPVIVSAVDAAPLKHNIIDRVEYLFESQATKDHFGCYKCYLRDCSVIFRSKMSVIDIL